jgi:hypothetical protein
MFDIATWLRRIRPEKCPSCSVKNPFRLKYGSDTLLTTKTREIPAYMAGNRRQSGFATQTTEQWQGLFICQSCHFEKPKTWRRVFTS